MTSSLCNAPARVSLAKRLDRGAVLACAAVFWLLFCAPFFVHAGEKSSRLAFPEWVRVLDLDGKHVDPFRSPSGKGEVFIFVSVDCPVSNGYMPEYRRLVDEFTPKGIVFRLVFPNGDESAEDIRKHLAAYKCAIPALRDPNHELVKVAEARATPEAAVFAAGHGLVYHGRIDDRQVELGRTRPAATRHDLREAIEAVLHGRLPEVRATRAVGCSIAGLP